MAASRSPLPLVVLLLCLVGAGGGLYWWVNQQNSLVIAETTPAPRVAPVAIHDAALAGDAGAIEKAIKGGASVEATMDGATRSHRGLTPLMLSAMNGKIDGLRALIKAGAKIDRTNQGGWTALMLAAAYGNPETVQMLLDAGAAVNARIPEDQSTSLMLAAAKGNTETVKALLAKGADTNFRNKWGETALLQAARAKSAESVQAILGTSPDVNIGDQQGNTPLSVACEAGDASPVVKALLDAKANPEAASATGVTPLMQAAFLGDDESVKMLLAAGAKLDVKDKDGRTAADWALSRNDEKGKALAELLKAK